MTDNVQTDSPKTQPPARFAIWQDGYLWSLWDYESNAKENIYESRDQAVRAYDYYLSQGISVIFIE